MGKTFRRNDGRRPKWDKHGKKSRKLREFEDEKQYGHPQHRPPPLPTGTPEESTEY